MSAPHDDQSEETFPTSTHTHDEDAKENKKKAGRELIVVAVVLFFIFVVFLPQFIDYGQVVDAMLKLTIGQIVLLFVLGVAKTWFDAGVYNTLIPGLKWWDGWKAWALRTRWRSSPRPAPTWRSGSGCIALQASPARPPGPASC